MGQREWVVGMDEQQRGLHALALQDPVFLRDQLEVPDRVNGAVVAEVRPGSPAESAGLRQGDVVVGVGGTAVRTPDDAARAIRTANKDGKGVALRVVRDGHARFVAVPGSVG